MPYIPPTVAYAQETQASNFNSRILDFSIKNYGTGIVWGLGALPFPECPPSHFGGAPNSFATDVANRVNASAEHVATDLRTKLLNAVYLMSNVRLVRFRKNLLGDIAPAGITFDQTARAYMSDAYRISPTVVLASDLQPINNTAELEKTRVDAVLQSIWTKFDLANNPVLTITIDVCHSSCHSNCHSNRGRR